MPKLLKLAAAADMLDVSPRTVYRLLGSGQLPGCKIGGAVRIDAEDLEKYISDQKAAFSLSVGFF